MIQCIEPHKYDVSFHHQEPAPCDFVFAPRGDTVLVKGIENEAYLPTFQEMETAYPPLVDPVFLFSIDETSVFLLQDSPDPQPGFFYQPIGLFRTTLPRWKAFAGITASHLAGWYGKNRFCGKCGGMMQPKETERAMHCPGCDNLVFPSISPAVIVAVTDGDKLLMTRYANRPTRNLALVAGFMEVGEALEDTVRREVMEETGVRVKNIRYYKSQPWAFSSSMLAGFFADLDGSNHITVDTNELEEAMWVHRNDIPDQNLGVAMTAEMIDAFRRGEYPA